jgi:hypothetical protein
VYDQLPQIFCQQPRAQIGTIVELDTTLAALTLLGYRDHEVFPLGTPPPVKRF